MFDDPNSSTTDERRKWPRRRIELLIRCRPANGTERICFTRNLSEGGLMFESPVSFPPEAPVHVGWYAPLKAGGARMRRYLELSAKVSWSQPIPDGQEAAAGTRFQVGLEFEHLTDDDRTSVALSCRTGRLEP